MVTLCPEFKRFLTIPDPMLPNPIKPNVKSDGLIFFFIKDVDILWTSNGVISYNFLKTIEYNKQITKKCIFTAILTSGLSNRVLVFRTGDTWLFVRPRFVRMSVLLKRAFFTFTFESSWLGVEVLFCTLLRLLVDDEEEEFEVVAVRALDWKINK